MVEKPVTTQRIDKWLWHARFARTRTAAQKVITSGRVRINREKVNATSQTVRVGDVLTLVVGDHVRIIAVLGIADRRGSAEKARLLYDDRSPAREPPTSKSVNTSGHGPTKRPDKRDRRRLAALKRTDGEGL